MKVYLAAPLFTLEERNHNHEVAQMLETYVKDLEVCLPQCVEADGSGIAQDILKDDLNLLDSCDAVLALCNGPDVDSGTAFEVGYALASGKDVVIYRNDRPVSYRHLTLPTNSLV